jgi:RNA polymerase sigma-70 factor (ECF subfamily)
VFWRQYFLSWLWSWFSSWNVSWWDKLKEEYLSDTEVVQYIINGKKEYFEIIVDRRWQKLFRYLYYYFSFDQITAEDAVQEVFVHVWKQLDTYDSSKKFSTRLYTVARNKTIDWLRQHKWEHNTQTIHQWDLIEDTHRHSENKKWKGFLIQKILQQLKVEYREVMILYYFEEYNYTEIADIIWSNKNSVWTLLRRAKKEVEQLVVWDSLLSNALEVRE